MTTYTLKINDFNVTSHPVQYTCYGLGSCVGLFITDRAKGLSGGAHIQLPFSCDTGEIPNASQLITEMLTHLNKKGSDLSCLRAKMAGGAQIYPAATNIGHQNVNVVTEILIHKRIFIAAQDVGGVVSRTARFFSNTGELQITTSGITSYSI